MLAHAPDAALLGTRTAWLFLLAVPIAAISWTVTREEVFREPREFCVLQSRSGGLLKRKLAYLFTCEFCFSHYVTLFFLLLTDYHLLLDDWRGMLIGFFALVWVANVYMTLYTLLRVDITQERTVSKKIQKEIGEEE
ncbi:MAG: hypothetical protein ACLFV3_08280 [Phycisphaeraceae bacterium]